MSCLGRRGLGKWNRCLPWLALLLLVSAGGTARADDVAVRSFRPSLHGGDTLGIRTANMPEPWQFGAGVWFDYGFRPLRIDGGPDLVTHMALADIYAHLSFTRWLNVGIGLPLHFVDGPGLREFAVGDLRLGLKARILGGNGRGVGLAFQQDLTFPTASKDAWVGDELVTGTSLLVLDWSGKGWNVAVNLGARLKKAVDFQVGGSRIHESGHQILIGAGFVAPLICGRLEALGTLEFRTALMDPFASEYDNQIDLLGGLRAHVRGVTLTAAAGGAPLKGYGSPMFRGVFSVGYEGKPVAKGCPSDRDRDGICDSDDLCPDQPGPAWTRGCPDRDGDGVPDHEDACPDEAGARNARGCPDRDGDGVPDFEDACPDEPGSLAARGCPEAPRARLDDGVQTPVAHVAPVVAPRLSIPGQVLFAFDRADLTGEAHGVLESVRRFLADHPEVKRVRIEGYTDAIGAEAYNVGLANRRAEAVRRWLVERGVESGRLEAVGLGRYNPVERNDTPEGRRLNRRVQFLVLDP